MKRKTIETIATVFIIILVIIAACFVIFGLYSWNEETNSLIRQCQALGYDTFEHQGWTGDFCIGTQGSLQVINYHGKISEVKR